MNKNFKKALVATMAATTVATGVAPSVLTTVEATEEGLDSREKIGQYDSNIKYQNGIYVGESKETFSNSVLKMSVEILDGKIKNIQYVEDDGNYIYPDTKPAGSMDFKQKAFEITKKIIGEQNPYKVYHDLHEKLKGKEPLSASSMSENDEYAAVTGATFTARGISGAVADALDVSRKASESKVVSEITVVKLPTTNIYKNSNINKALIGDKINLSEISIQVSYSGGIKEIIPFNNLKAKGFEIICNDPITNKPIELNSKNELLIKEPFRVYQIQIKKDGRTGLVKIISMQRHFIEDDLLYKIGEKGDYSKFELIRESDQRGIYDVDKEAIDRNEFNQTSKELVVKTSQIGDNLHFKTTGYTCSVTGGKELLPMDKQAFTYKDFTIPAETEFKGNNKTLNFSLERRGKSEDKVQYTSFSSTDFKMQLRLVDDKNEQIESLKKLINDIENEKTEGLSEKKRAKLDELKKSLDSKKEILKNEANKTSKEIKSAVVELQEKYDEYKNFSEKIEVNRFAGKNRFATSAEISKKTYDNADTVVLVNGYKNSDALTAVPFAQSIKAPILFTNENKVPASIISEISRLKAKNVIIIGGQSSVSDTLKKADLKGLNVERISGKNRYETSTKVAQRLVEKTGKTGKAILVNGMNMVDALSVPSLDKKFQGPILLTGNKTLDKNSEAFINSNSVNMVTVIGGNNSVSSAIETKLKNSKINTTRIAGANRYETSRKIASTAPNKDEVIVASGVNYVDALSVGTYALKNDSALIVLRDGQELNATKKHIEDTKAKKVTIVGGIATISEKIKDVLASITR